MNAQPRSVATQFSLLCGYIAASMEAMKRDGPHYGYWINVFMNEPARKHFEGKSAEAYQNAGADYVFGDFAKPLPPAKF